MQKNEHSIKAGPDAVVTYLSNVQFRKKAIGGVDEYDVWRKIRELNDLYVKEMEEQRVRYETLIKERDKVCQQAMLYIRQQRNGEEPNENG